MVHVPAESARERPGLGGVEGVWRGFVEYRRCLQGVLYSTRGAQTSKTLVTNIVNTQERGSRGGREGVGDSRRGASQGGGDGDGDGEVRRTKTHTTRGKIHLFVGEFRPFRPFLRPLRLRPFFETFERRVSGGPRGTPGRPLLAPSENRKRFRRFRRGVASIARRNTILSSTKHTDPPPPAVLF
eukprot:260231-Prorocentrum_minimum.AAC.1